MTNKYTIEELKEKVCCKVDEESIKYNLPLLSPTITEQLDEILPFINEAYKDLVKEKLTLLIHDRRGNCDEGFRVEDIEELFNIKLK